MINTHTEKPLLNNVTAVFAGGSQSFLLPQDATLEEIADRIDHLSVRQERGAVAVVVKFASTVPQVARPRLSTPFRDGLLPELPRLRAFARSPWPVTPIGQMISCKKHLLGVGTSRQVQRRHEPGSLALHNPAQHLLWGIAFPPARSVRQRWTPCGPAHQPTGATSPPRASERCPRL